MTRPKSRPDMSSLHLSLQPLCVPSYVLRTECRDLFSPRHHQQKKAISADENGPPHLDQELSLTKKYEWSNPSCILTSTSPVARPLASAAFSSAFDSICPAATNRSAVPISTRICNEPAAAWVEERICDESFSSHEVGGGEPSFAGSR